MYLKKPVVMYDRNREFVCLGPGHRAFLVPLNHESEHVTNGKLVCTSPVVEYNDVTGTVVTKNTIYKPYSKCQIDSMKLLPKSLIEDNG